MLSRFAGVSIRGGRIESINCGVDRGAVLRRGCRLYNKQRLTYVQATIFFNTQYTLDVRYKSYGDKLYLKDTFLAVT